MKKALAAVAAFLLGAGGTCAGNVDIVTQGHSGYVVSTPASPSPAEELAARELTSYLERMSGARLEIHQGVTAPRRALVVCEQKNLAALIGSGTGEKGVRNVLPERPDQPSVGARCFAQKVPDTFSSVNVTGDEYAVATRGQQILLVGSRGRSTLYAVYDFLGALGCRWLAPRFAHYGGAAESIPKKEDLTWAGADRIERPGLRLRTLNIEEGLSHTPENLIQLAEWMPKVRCNTIAFPIDYYGEGRAVWDKWRDEVLPEIRRRDLTLEVGGHGYENFLNAEMEAAGEKGGKKGVRNLLCEAPGGPFRQKVPDTFFPQGRLFQQHPEWFGLDAKRKRRPEHRYVFCSSNGDALRYLTANVIKYLQAHPEIQVFDLRPPDMDIWCTCEACKALGSVSQRLALIATHVQGEVSKVLCGLPFEIQGYSHALQPPEFKLPAGITVGFCPINQSFELAIDDPASAGNAEYAQTIKAWRPKTTGPLYVYSYYRKYAWRSLPVVLPHTMQRDLRFYGSVPVDGVSSYAEPGNWFTFEVNSYVLAQLAWNPAADVDGLMAEFCRARFGAAAAEAGRAYQTLEAVVPRFCNILFTSLKSAGEVSAAGGKIASTIKETEAAQSSAVDPAAQRALDKLLLMLEYARRDLGIQKLRALRKGPEPKPPLAAVQTAIEQLQAFLAQHADEGVFLVEPRLTTERLYRWYYLPRKK